MDRRQFLQGIGAFAATAGVSSSVMAASAEQPRFLLVFLRGGYDASHLLVPVSSSFYYESRPNIAIPRPSERPESALALNADWGLHPALRDTMLPLFQQGELSFIPFAGTDDLTRSHFETQDSIELGQALNGKRDFHSGFLNRLAAVIQPQQPMQCMAFTDQLPLIFQGDARVANLALKNPAKMQIDQRQSQIIRDMYQKSRLQDAVTEGFNVRADVMRELQEEMNSANRNAISTKGFALEAQRIARLMREKYALGFIDVGGWDTHVDQGSSKGTLANKFEELGKGLQTFREEMGGQWKNTTVVVISEFGRTFRENGKRGTDHGHGSVYWVLGGSVKGGKIAGDQQQLTASTLFQNRDYPVLNEYRAVLGGLFARMYGLSDSQLAQVFGGVRPRDLHLI